MPTTASRLDTAAIITLNIIPDSDTIHTFSNDDSTLPNESYILTGKVEVSLARSIQIRQLSIKFKGTVDSVITGTDFFNEHYRHNKYRDEIPIAKWDTVGVNNSFVNKFARKALGHGNATLTVINEQLDLFTQPQVLRVGTTVYPFSLNIKNVHLLPPSLLSPHHIIKYILSARIRLNSIGERVKLSYWNARSTFVSNSNHVNTSSVSSYSSTNPIVAQLHYFSYSANMGSRSLASCEEDFQVDNYGAAASACPTTPSTIPISKWNQLQETSIKYKRQLLGVSTPIQLCRHSYPNIYSLSTSVAQIRYRGAREGRITYEICMSKFTCLQKRSFPFICKFNSLCEESKIEYMEYYLEQTESYPIRTCNFGLNEGSFSISTVPRRRKLCRTKHNMMNYQNNNELKLYLRIDLPHISPNVDTRILQITHRLRLILTFKDSKIERNMSLSFPLVVGTVPVYVNSSSGGAASPDQHLLSWPTTIFDYRELNGSGGTHRRRELDEWLLTPTDQNYSFNDTDNDWNKLPSYPDVLKEGNPPSPFLEDII
ncbi:hypothetical protein BDF20DRAFT_868052 [Mycotypha africana]|uniref:uncharacterized protein n=1 Tax=Mycotypha africana TaxID=64632 RepID=UPI00230159E2|nr:uncharacterized protein BDF20DRAFT_868052 [Mycotypha africana]KAI8979176.1 hypothetical protein BDF20DRAFT_868052 [Mycotypha africana]